MSTNNAVNVQITPGPISLFWKVLSADQAVAAENPLVLHEITELTVALEASSTYWFKYYMNISTGAVAQGVFYTLNYSGTSANIAWKTELPLGRNVIDDKPFYGSVNDEGIKSTGQAALTDTANRYPHYMFGNINTTTAGDLKVNMQSELVTSGTFTVHKGSMLELIKVVT
jgi:hypothetical protein